MEEREITPISFKTPAYDEYIGMLPAFALLGMMNVYMGRVYRKDHTIESFWPSASLELVKFAEELAYLVAKRDLTLDYPHMEILQSTNGGGYVLNGKEVAEYLHSDKFFVPDGMSMSGKEQNLSFNREAFKQKLSEQFSFLWGASKVARMEITPTELKYCYGNSSDAVNLIETSLIYICQRGGQVFRNLAYSYPTSLEVGCRVHFGKDPVQPILKKFEEFDRQMKVKAPSMNVK